MILDFAKIEEQKLESFKGGKGVMLAKMYFDGKNRVILGKLVPGSSIGFHKHELNSELIYILSGTGTVKLEQGQEIVTPGQVHYCPQGSSHALCNEGSEDLTFYAVVPEHHQ